MLTRAAALALAAGMSLASHAMAATQLVNETYQMTVSGFQFAGNFWSSMPGSTGAGSPVPVSSLSFTFSLSYFTPAATAANFGDPLQSFRLDALSMTFAALAGVSLAETLTQDDLSVTMLQATMDDTGELYLRLGGYLDGSAARHRLTLLLPHFTPGLPAEEGTGATADLALDSLKIFDSPNYRAQGGGPADSWTTTRLSSTAIDIGSVPLPATGGFLGAALCLARILARRRTGRA